MNVSLIWENKSKTLLGFDDNKHPIWGNLSDLRNLHIKEKQKYGEDSNQNPNLLIKGDNLHSLYKLQDNYKSKIKCIYIDPPFNTGKVFDHYADVLNRDVWLSMMKIRLELMKELLSEDGAIFIHIDDDEMPYLKILLDEIFECSDGNKFSKNNNHIATIVWQKKNSPQNDARFFSDVHDYILVYAKNRRLFKMNKIERTTKQNSRYKNLDNDNRGPWTSSDLTAKTPSDKLMYEITLPSGRIVSPSKSRSWSITKEKLSELISDNRIWFGKNGDAMPRLKTFLSEVQDGVVPKTIWTIEEVGDNSEGKREIKKLTDINEVVFTTPKPERLIERIIKISTNEGDLVLDAFLGSGTTCAVAQKTKRCWIGLENGDQLENVCIPRLVRVIEGKDNGGVTKNNDWNGGGGFTYCTIE